MASFFKIPSLKKKDKTTGLPTFNWATFEKEKKIGSGTFGSVYMGKYGGRDENVVVKKLKYESFDSKARCLKEAALLNSTQGHQNIIKFIGFCDEPHAIMMEHACFDFRPFGIEKSVSSLEDFFHFVDEECEFSSFAEVMPVCAKDIIAGLQHLHNLKIAHRDLKPGNILVSNQHYTGCFNGEIDLANAYGKCPIVCKLADFGLSRSLDLQTKSFLMSKTVSVCRGTLAFMAPEIHLKQFVQAGQEELKNADIWSLGMVMYSLLNPNVSSPYRAEIEQLGIAVSEEAFKDYMQRQTLPEHDRKYGVLRVTEWWQIQNAFESCCTFNPTSRPSASQLLDIFNCSRPEELFQLFPLAVSQATALEELDHEVAVAIDSGNLVKDMEPPLSDGTNCCAFLALGICDHFLQEIGCAQEASPAYQWNLLKETVENVVKNLPAQVSQVRNADRYYDVNEANAILSNSNFLASKYELSEECVSGSRVFSHSGRAELVNAFLKNIPTSSTNVPQMGLYTCSPYIFTLGMYNNALFLIDTHPVPGDVGGNGNGLMMITQDCTVRSCELLVQWILRRLKVSGVKEDQHQSFSWVTRYEEQVQRDVDRINADKTTELDNLDVFVQDDDSLEILAQNSTVCDPETKNKRKAGELTLADERRSKRHQGQETCGCDEINDGSDVEKFCTISTDSPEIVKIIPGKSQDIESEGIRSAECYLKDVLEPTTNSLDSTSSSDEQDNNIAPHSEMALYNGDALTPVFSWKREPYIREEVVRILLEEHETERLCISQPINVAHNVTFLIENAKMKNEDDIKCDDMGSWKRTGTPKNVFRVKRNNNGNIKKIRHVRIEALRELDPEMYNLKRTYYVNKSSNDVRKVVSTLLDYRGDVLKYTLVQYLFKNKEHPVDIILPHGNSKQKKPYHRMLASTRDALKRSTSKETPKEVLDKVYTSVGDVSNARSIGELPRGPTDLYNARFSSKQKSSQINEVDGINGIWALLEKAKREEESCNDSVFIRECRVHPDFLVILATNRQLDDLKRFCTNPNDFCVFGVDPTFNIFEQNISLTVTTYRNLKLHNRTTNEPPVFIGPLLMHQHKDWKTYSRFANFLTTECLELEGMLACGTDGERALIDGLKRNFRYALFLRCFSHFRDNLRRELNKRGLPNYAIGDFITEIFGKQEGNTLYQGLVDCNSEEEFDVKLAGLQKRWDAREAEYGRPSKDRSSFFEWFCKEKANDVKESMLKPIRMEAGLGDPPKEYLNNDPESANFIIKHSLQFEPKQPQQFIEEVKNVIETQYRNEDRAVFGKGMYKVRKEFQHLVVDDKQWSKMTHAQRVSKLKTYQKTGVDGKKTHLDVHDDETRSTSEPAPSSAKHLSVSAAESGITTIPMPILDAMFEKTNRLLSCPENIIPKPGATDGSFIVPGHSNTIHIVTPGKGGSLKCDRSCINSSTKICEHVLAVAHTRGTISEYLAWYKRSKRGPKLLEMALESAPKSAGKKPSNRKKSNRQKPPVTEVRDLLDEVGSALPKPHAASIIPNNIPSSFTPMSTITMPDATRQTARRVSHNPHSAGFTPSASPRLITPINTITTPDLMQQTERRDSQNLHPAGFTPNASPRSITPMNMITTPDLMQQTARRDSHNLHPAGFTPSASPGLITPINTITTPDPPLLAERRDGYLPVAVQQTSDAYLRQATQTQTRSSTFRLKWVNGTRVSKCYGCNKEIKNPPQSLPDDIVVVYRDIRQYRDRITGLLQFSSEPQNIHFHLKIACIREKYPNFLEKDLVVPPEFPPHLKVEHVQRLVGEFGWVL